MTPKEIIEALQEYYKDSMDTEIDMEDFADAIMTCYPGNKEHLKEALEDFNV